MRRIYYSDQINNSFYEKFKIKKKTLLVFNYLPLKLIKLLYKIKKFIK